jgi:hypothetical protein
LVFELPIVGFGEVLQQTPTAVIADPPEDVTVPPELAEFAAIEDIVAVVTVGVEAVVAKLTSFP